MKTFIISIMLSLFISVAYAADRCVSYVNDVRIQHTKYFGITFPYWYGVGQLQQESNCRASITSFDSGQGIAQFMPKTEKYILSLMGETLNPYNPSQAIKMQAFYMNRIHTRENWGRKALWVNYQIYNGGKSILYKEYIKAGEINHTKMKNVCTRKKIPMKWGVLDMCDVNYDYSVKIAKYGEKYRKGPDGMVYW